MSNRFEPKTPVNLAPPKNDPISPTELKKANGMFSNLSHRRKTSFFIIPTNFSLFIGRDSDLCYVAIKGKVFDVSGNKAYLPGGPYHNFAGYDASRALALTSTNVEDVGPEWEDLSEKEKQVLEDWMTFFSKRYNVVGVVQE
ncbi:putative steroid-binding protein 3 [Erysiphe neolycopersici]|uniref:Putative steroid-binding protein 3 n=1 Tax=Erysiphe neolycopersici TaxID=212602 RepID=A0A420HA22_9PEZI|nr:putative steroid-binding protein 3 [Erysiphe neolycopersici]